MTSTPHPLSICKKIKLMEMSPKKYKYKTIGRAQSVPFQNPALPVLVIGIIQDIIYRFICHQVVRCWLRQKNFGMFNLAWLENKI